MSHDASSNDRRFVSVKLKRNNDFQEKFKDKISVTNKDGSFTKIADSNYSRFASTNKIIGHRAKSSSSFFTENHRTQIELPQSHLPLNSEPPPILSNSLRNQAHLDNSTRSSFISTISKDEDVEEYSYNDYDSFPKSQKSAAAFQTVQEPPRKKPVITASELKRMVEDNKPAIYVPSLYEKKSSSPTSNSHSISSKVFNPVNRILHLQEQLSPNPVNSSRSDQGRITEKVKTEEIFVHKSETSPSTPVKAQHNFPRFFMQNNLTPSRNVSDAAASPERRVQGGYAEAHSNSSSYKTHIRKLAQEAEAKLKQDPQKHQQKQPEDSFYYSKKPREVTDFKPYTLSDYKNEFISNSGFYEMKPLGPDLQSQELLEKQKKREKMLQYANCVKEFNTEQINRDVFVPSSTQKDNTKPREKSARERALEFAKSNIPKPVRRPSPLNVPRRSKGLREDDEYEEPAPLSALELMELKNQQDREWIKSEFGLM